MSPPAPSREVLRILTRLCRSEHVTVQHSTAISNLHTTRRCRVPGISPSQQILSRHVQTRSKSTLVEPLESHTIANHQSRHEPQQRGDVEPKSQDAIDPQNGSSATTLPDITNYYTLFPKTLPGGPPRPTSSVPDSSQLTKGKPPSTPAFYINPRELRKEFLQLQSVHHPDKFPAGSVGHQRAYALSTLLNNAYKTLIDPLLRSQYLLQLQYDIDVTTEDNSAHQGNQEDLMVVLDAQEDLEGAAEATADEAEKVVERLKDENTSRMRESERRIGAAFENGNKDAAKDEAVRLKYWHTLDSSLKDWTPGRELTLIH